MIIVHIDNDADDRELLVEAIKEIDANVVCMQAENGREGYNLVSNSILTTKIDCIFLDINMPLMNGIECLQLLKENTAANDILVVMYTTTGNRDELKTIVAVGATFLQKSPTYKDLLDEVRKVLTSLDHRRKESF